MHYNNFMSDMSVRILKYFLNRPLLVVTAFTLFGCMAGLYVARRLHDMASAGAVLVFDPRLLFP